MLELEKPNAFTIIHTASSSSPFSILHCSMKCCVLILPSSLNPQQTHSLHPSPSSHLNSTPHSSPVLLNPPASSSAAPPLIPKPSPNPPSKESPTSFEASALQNHPPNHYPTLILPLLLVQSLFLCRISCPSIGLAIPLIRAGARRRIRFRNRERGLRLRSFMN